MGIDDPVDAFLVKVTLRGCIGDFSVIPILRACSNYLFSFAFHMYVKRCLLSDAYNHSKQMSDFMQTTTNKNCKEKETCIYSKGGVWPSSFIQEKGKGLCGNNLVKFQLC